MKLLESKLEFKRVFVYTLQTERQKVSIGLNYEQTEEKQKVEKTKEEKKQDKVARPRGIPVGWPA